MLDNLETTYEFSFPRYYINELCSCKCTISNQLGYFKGEKKKKVQFDQLRYIWQFFEVRLEYLQLSDI